MLDLSHMSALVEQFTELLLKSKSLFGSRVGRQSGLRRAALASCWKLSACPDHTRSHGPPNDSFGQGVIFPSENDVGLDNYQKMNDENENLES